MHYADQIGKVDRKTMKISKWKVPTSKSYPRRIEVDTDGMSGSARFDAGKIVRFDPKSETFKEYPLAGPEPTPTASPLMRIITFWYSSYHLDTLGRLDPKTGKVTEYPFPHSENTIREFFPDSQGRLWYGTPSNNKVGLLLTEDGKQQARAGRKLNRLCGGSPGRSQRSGEESPFFLDSAPGDASLRLSSGFKPSVSAHKSSASAKPD